MKPGKRRRVAHKRHWLHAVPSGPPPAHLSAPAAVSLTARLGSSSSGPRRRTASRRARSGSAGGCCTSRASPAQAHSRTSALGCWSCGTGARAGAGAGRRRAALPHGPAGGPLPRPAPGAGGLRPHLFQQLRRRPVDLLSLGPVLRRCQLGHTVARRGELRSPEALRPALSHDGVRWGEDRERDREEDRGKVLATELAAGSCGRGEASGMPLSGARGGSEPTWRSSAQARGWGGGGGRVQRRAGAEEGWAGPDLARGRSTMDFPGQGGWVSVLIPTPPPSR